MVAEHIRLRLIPILLGLVGLATLTTPACAASWAESWFDNATYSSPGSFDDQTRGYLTAGGMSGRVDVHNDYLMSLTLPKIKAGCGGIDMFLGGMSSSIRTIWSRSSRASFRPRRPSPSSIFLKHLMKRWETSSPSSRPRRII
jgi:hypothetical protein